MKRLKDLENLEKIQKNYLKTNQEKIIKKSQLKNKEKMLF